MIPRVGHPPYVCVFVNVIRIVSACLEPSRISQGRYFTQNGWKTNGYIHPKMIK